MLLLMSRHLMLSFVEWPEFKIPHSELSCAKSSKSLLQFNSSDTCEAPLHYSARNYTIVIAQYQWQWHNAKQSVNCYEK